MPFTLHLVTTTQFPYLRHRITYICLLGLSFGDIQLSFGDNFLSFGDIILSFGDIFLNDSMIFFALYFPNPRKSHKSHR